MRAAVCFQVFSNRPLPCCSIIFEFQDNPLKPGFPGAFNFNPQTKRPQVNRSTFPPQHVMPDAEHQSRQPRNSHQQKAGVERERKASSLRADPPRPPPARHFHFKSGSSGKPSQNQSFRSHAPASERKKM